MKKYKIIYADPPWKFNFKNRRGLSEKAKGNLYDTMSGEDIKALEVKRIAKNNSVLFLWVMNSELKLALDVIESWGFTYKTVAFTWVKKRVKKFHFGGGNWTRNNPELCLISTRGKVKRVSRSVRNLQIHKLGRHSEKPGVIRDEIIRLVGDGDKIELFAREKKDGWDVWGNEVECDIDLN